MGYSDDSKLLKKVLVMMKAHPNYSDPVPLPGESKVVFALRWASHLISPPQEEGESYDLECTDVACAILALEDDIEAAWNKAYPKPR